jgi:hypothetical protein
MAMNEMKKNRQGDELLEKLREVLQNYSFHGKGL